ncbi:sensor histidine kinase [Pseudonocardia sp. GCM10023141]|uniref:sensor histidine kinase n=1 Tax=Pseudonocardia sp. GCM10023141 TaxID=3252653 RepID=UPI00360F2A8E
MRRAPLHPAVRRALLRHGLLTGAVAVVLSGVLLAGAWMIAQSEALRTAQRVSTQVAGAMTVSLSKRDYRQPQPGRHEEMVRDLAPFLGSGMVYRVKVWLADGAQARIVFSDEPRNEGDVRTFGAALVTRLDAGEAVAKTVPRDDEHRFEIAEGHQLVEVYIGFTDAAGVPMRLEVYIPVDVASATEHGMAVLLPLLLGGLLALGLLTIPLTVSLARRMERERAERREALHYGLAASDLERRALAQQLHDGVIQDLAGTGLLLDAIRRAGDHTTLLDRAHHLVEKDVQLLRGLATDRLPAAEVGDDLAAALADLVAHLSTPPAGSAAPAIEVVVELPTPLDGATVVLLHRVARELLRNAVRHSGAHHIDVSVAAPGKEGTAGYEAGGHGAGVTLTVTDDGRGFDPDRPAADGHLGLHLVRRTVADAGGSFTVTSAPARGTTVTATVPARPVTRPATRSTTPHLIDFP